MTLQSLVKNFLENSNNWKKSAIICFSGQEYPYFFMKDLLKIAEAKNMLPAIKNRFQITNQEPKNLIPLLQQASLGAQSFFWLGDLSENFTNKQIDYFLNNLISRSIENFISFFLSDDLLKKFSIESISIPLTIEVTDYEYFLKNFKPKILENPQKIQAVERIFNLQQKINLNVFMQLLDFIELVNTKDLKQLFPYINSFIMPDNHLYTLSQTFFKKDPVFFAHWHSLSLQYPPIFWLSFWSEQWWKAYHLVAFARQKNIILAKKFGSKLPYSFITKDWELYQPNYFQKLLSRLYLIDFSLKQGRSFCFFDLIYGEHFAQTKI